MFIQAQNLSQALVRLCLGVEEHGVYQDRRGFKCKEFPGPVIIEISNPTDRFVYIPERKWNKTLGWVESLWIARGDNSMEMPGAYVKNLFNYSDDGEYMRAGYGPRIRRFGHNRYKMKTRTGLINNQYKSGVWSGDSQLPYDPIGIDQLRYVIEKFREDPTTREAAITIHDPNADNFDYQGEPNYKPHLLKTKDTPCTRSIHFMVVDGKMNCYVDMRSNDILWGFSAVNVFNFTLMQEYVAGIVGVPVGKYYHKADNLHVYENHFEVVRGIASRYTKDDFPSVADFKYTPSYNSLEKFDSYIGTLTRLEEQYRVFGGVEYQGTVNEFLSDLFSGDQLFSDWAKVIMKYWKPDLGVEPFLNPFLNKLFA